MTIARKITLTISAVVIALWLLAWLPVEVLPQFLHWTAYWFGGLLTFLLLPAVAGVWWSLRKPVKSMTPNQIAEG